MVATQQIEINTLYHGSMLSSIPIVSALILPSTARNYRHWSY